jgi:hypothetical protein
MAGTDPRNKLLRKVIGAAATVLAAVLAAYITGAFGMVLSLINSHTKTDAPTPPQPSIIVSPIITNTNTVSVGEQSRAPGPKHQPSQLPTTSAGLSSDQEQVSRNPLDTKPPDPVPAKPATTPTSLSGICDAGPDRVAIHLVLPLMEDADLYADGQMCREQIPSKVNMTIFLANGTHHLVLKRDDESCSAYATVTSPENQQVILRCE